jgi:hypothetical protein
VVRNVAKGACLPMMGRQWQECAITGHPPRAWRTRQLDPEQTFSLGIRNGRNARMSGPSIEQADSGWHLG